MLSDPSPPESRPSIRVALVVDDVSFRNAVAAAIASAPDMTLSGVASTRSGGLQMLEGEPSDVLLVDLGLPDGSGIDVIRAAHVRWPKCNTMVSTAFGDEMHVMQSLEAGAVGYLLKDSAPERLVLEIRNLHAGGSPISPLIARQVLTRFRPPALAPASVGESGPKTVRAVLSGRETEVLELITKGFSTGEIAALMSVSQHTVLTYVRRIYSKLEVNSRTEAIYEARNQGLLAG
jgi:DNA-binding NarL/FixJ family response regulator